MKFLDSDHRMTQALSEWAEIAPTLGLDAAAFRSKLIWQKDEATRSHVVVRLKGPRKLILKRTFVAQGNDDLVEKVITQREVFRQLAAYPKAHVPDVLFASDDGTFVVMNEATGKTLNDLLLLGRPHDQLLRRAGAWLSAYHTSGSIETRTYQPRFMVNQAERLAKEVKANTLSVVMPHAFTRCCAQIGDVATQAMDQQTVSSCKHGDFNLRNILLGPDGETGLDFKPASTAPVGFDIARLLLDYAELFQPIEDVTPGAILSQKTLNAFFKGYDVVTRDDPAVRFLPYVQLLTDWRAVPVDPSKRSWRQAARMKNITALANNAFNLT